MTLMNDDREPIVAGEEEHEMLLALSRVLTDGESQVVGADGAAVPLPPSVARLLLRAAALMAQGEAVALVAYPEHLTVPVAAQLLQESPASLVQLLDEGTLPFTEKHLLRFVRYADLMAYKRERDAGRAEALDELVRISEELGLYEWERTHPEAFRRQ